MVFRPAEGKDREAVLRLWKEGRESLRAMGVPQWQKGSYPGQDDFEKDLEEGIGYVLEKDGVVVAYSAFTVEPDPSYIDIDGEWLGDDNYATTHRSAVSLSERGQGLLSTLLSELSAMARSIGRTSMRTDTHEGNIPMQHALKRAGYSLSGRIVLVEGDEKGDPRLGFSKLL